MPVRTAFISGRDDYGALLGEAARDAFERLSHKDQANIMRQTVMLHAKLTQIRMAKWNRATIGCSEDTLLELVARIAIAAIHNPEIERALNGSTKPQPPAGSNLSEVF